ncbi:MAG: DUF805 domain-containing protein [Pseudomonadota bacterium]
MTFSEAVSTVLGKYAVFSGRAGRAEFWWWFLALLIVTAVAQLVDRGLVSPMFGYGMFSDDAIHPVSAIINLAVLLPNLGVNFRRLHDTDRSAWWILIALIPIIGILVLLYFFTQPGSRETNRFGPPPAL